MNQSKDSTRESFWNIDREDRIRFSLGFSLVFLIGLLSVFVYQYWWADTKGDILNSLIVLVKSFVGVGLFAFMFIFLCLEGRDAMGLAKILLEEKRRERFEEGRQEGRQEGHRELLDAIKKAYPDLDLSSVQADIRSQNEAQN